MGKRCEPRQPVQIEVRIFGTDEKGRVFSEKTNTLDVSRCGARLCGVKAKIKVDEIVGLTNGQNRVHFRVRWVGQPGTSSEGQIGLQNLTPERPLWDMHFPLAVIDTFHAESRGNRRRYPRVKCDVPLELHPEGQANLWGKASDICVGGCFIEMPIPLKIGCKFEVGLWIDETKMRLKGEVVSSAPGFGIGVRFVDASARDQEILRKHVESLSPQLT